MENYNDSFYNGGADDFSVDNVVTRFARDHFITTFVLAIIGVIALLIIVVMLISKLYNVMFKSDSFVGSYMHWRPNVQDKSELNAIMAANKMSPPLNFPTDLIKNDADPSDIDTNLGTPY
jgi:hypothetical protein